jgi:hypothetical protein
MRRFYWLICMVCLAFPRIKTGPKNAEHLKPMNHRSHSLGFGR